MIKNLFKSDSQIVAEIHREIDTAEVSRYIKDTPEKNLLEIERAQPLKREDRYIKSWDGLYIAAPKSHFNLKGLEKRRFGWFAPKDPIVFRYVRGGIQVLTKWGLEANDPSLINSIDN